MTFLHALEFAFISALLGTAAGGYATWRYLAPAVSAAKALASKVTGQAQASIATVADTVQQHLNSLK